MFCSRSLIAPLTACLTTTGLAASTALLQNINNPALAETSLARGQIIKICVNGLLYQNIFADGTPGGPTTGITQADAAIACRGVTSQQQSLEAKRCVNGLLYTRITDDGRPAGPATGLTTRNAAIACAINTSPLPR